VEFHSSNQGCRLSIPTSGIRARFAGFVGYLGSIKKVSLLFDFWKEQKGVSAWATRPSTIKFLVFQVRGHQGSAGVN
ncbi:hypothetical protein Tco_1529007, partial [Tanacetum coccineum]